MACKLCAEVFPSSKQLKSHRWLEHYKSAGDMQGVQTTNWRTGAVAAGKAVKEASAAGLDRPLRCFACTRIFGEMAELRQHLADEGHYRCRDCKQTFANVKKIKDHVRACKIAKEVKETKYNDGIIGICAEKKKFKMTAMQHLDLTTQSSAL